MSAPLACLEPDPPRLDLIAQLKLYSATVLVMSPILEQVPVLLTRIFVCVSFHWDVAKVGYLEQVWQVAAKLETRCS